MSSIPIPNNLWIPGESNVAFYLFGQQIAWYGIFVSFGFFVAIFLSLLKIWKIYKIPTNPFYYFACPTLFLAIFGAKVWSCIITKEWDGFFSITQISGLAIQGGVILVVLFSFFYFPLILKSDKYKIEVNFNSKPIMAKVSYWLYFDAIVPTILIGQVIGRWGNYFNQEIYGPIVNNAKLIKFLHDFLPYMYVNSKGAYCQPLFLWEGIINFFGFIIIYVGLEFIKKRKAGDLGFCYFVWYGIVRIILETLRQNQYTYIQTYFVSGFWIIIGSIFIVLNHTISQYWRRIKIWPSIKNLFYNFCQYFKFFMSKIYAIFKKNKQLYQKKLVKIMVKKSKNEVIFYKEIN